MREYSVKEKVAYYKRRQDDKSLTLNQRRYASDFLQGVKDGKKIASNSDYNSADSLSSHIYIMTANSADARRNIADRGRGEGYHQGCVAVLRKALDKAQKGDGNPS